MNTDKIIKKLRFDVVTTGNVARIHSEVTKRRGNMYLVGGAIRDAFLGVESNDWDFVVTGLNKYELQHALESIWGYTVDTTGKNFGVFRVKGYEISLARTEISTGPGHKDFKVDATADVTIEEDLKRRDFTMNAMAIDLSTGKLIDPLNGGQAVSNNEAHITYEKTFSDDPLRIMRGLVLVARYNSRVSLRTTTLMVGYKDGINNLPKERIQTELDKIFEGEYVANAIHLMMNIGLMKYIFPVLDKYWNYNQNNPHHSQLLGEHCWQTLEYVATINKDKDVRLAALLHDIGKPDSAWTDPATGMNHFYYDKATHQGAMHESVGAVLTEENLFDLKYPVSRIHRVSDLVQHHMWAPFTSEKGARKFLNRVGDLADDLLDIREADQLGKHYNNPQAILNKIPDVDKQRELLKQVREGKQPTKKSDLALDGHDLIALGVPAGPERGKILEDLTQLVIEFPELNTKDNLKEIVHTNYNYDSE